MRKLTKCFANKFGISIIFCLLIVSLAVVTFTVTAAPVSNDNLVVAHALEKDQPTMLKDGLGLQFGTNSLRTASSGDFYLVSGSGVTFNDSNISVTANATIATRVQFSEGDAIFSRVKYALQSEFISVSFNGSVSYQIAKTTTGDVNITTSILYAPALLNIQKAERNTPCRY